MRRYKYPTINTDTYTLNEDWERGRRVLGGKEGMGDRERGRRDYRSGEDCKGLGLEGRERNEEGEDDWMIGKEGKEEEEKSIGKG